MIVGYNYYLTISNKFLIPMIILFFWNAFICSLPLATAWAVSLLLALEVCDKKMTFWLTSRFPCSWIFRFSASTFSFHKESRCSGLHWHFDCSSTEEIASLAFCLAAPQHWDLTKPKFPDKCLHSHDCFLFPRRDRIRITFCWE